MTDFQTINKRHEVLIAIATRRHMTAGMCCLLGAVCTTAIMDINRNWAWILCPIFTLAIVAIPQFRTSGTSSVIPFFHITVYWSITLCAWWCAMHWSPTGALNHT
jgi:hypothetical protein